MPGKRIAREKLTIKKMIALYESQCPQASAVQGHYDALCGEAIIFTLIRDDEKMAQTQQRRGLRKILRILHSARENDLKMIFLH